jgi:hypothetical protein
MLLLIVFMIQALAAPAGMGAARAQGTPRCESPQAPGDRRVVTCPLSASGVLQTFRFTANFSGSHDDTMAALTATLDGAPLACAPGSKTDLMGEDGDVSLQCTFSLTGKVGAQHVLSVTLSWRHAQYTGFEFDSD